MAEPKTTPSRTLQPSIAKQIEEGKYQLVDPLDYLMLGYLPDEGSLFNGLYPNGETIKNLLQKFPPEQRKHLTTPMLSSRMRVMNLMGLAVHKVRTSSSAGSQVWQITKEGKRVLREWKGGSNGGGGNHNAG